MPGATMSGSSIAPVDGRRHRPLYFVGAKSVATFLMHRRQPVLVHHRR
jgi:hypothetical protein